ncbi:MAG: threonine dehydratase [Rhizobiales bacterium]|nr:threonine dehydratase [Hyphomicrobiales bacterium]
MELITLGALRPVYTPAELEKAKSIVYETMTPTLQHNWPLLEAELGCEVWLKHENHTPTGAFKVRGGLVHMRLRQERGETNGVITASTGNHGQSIPFAAKREGVTAVIVVPENNSAEKNAAMRALGAELVETGHDFNAAKDAMERMAEDRNLDIVPSFDRELVMGVSTYAHELFEAAGELDAVYVPIGMGSGCCGVIAARDMLGLKTEVIGVVSTEANAYALSYKAGKAISTNSIGTFAEGMAVRIPHQLALDYIIEGCSRIVEVSDDEIAEAMRLAYRATHNITEGAGAGALAGIMNERELMAGKRVGAIVSGGNIDAERYAAVLSGKTPKIKGN